jgi:hypothetical protein
MLASIPVNEMAYTLRVLAGDNAANAARHFTKRSYDMGDVSAAVLWSSIVQCLGGPVAPAAPEAQTAPEAPAVLEDPVPFHHIREGIAMQGVRYEDVDAETLAGEERAPVAVPPIPQRARSLKPFAPARAEKPAAEYSPDAAMAEIELAQAA